MRRPRLLTAVLLILLGVLALASIVYFLPEDEVGIDLGLYERLKLGMTEAEVVAAADIAPGDHTGAYAYTTSAPIREGELPLYVDYHLQPDGKLSGPHPSTRRPLRGLWWRGPRGLVIVFLGDNGRVVDRRFYAGKGRSWVGHQWDRLVR